MSKIRSVFCAAFVALAFTAFAIDYTTYTWTGKAGDGQWTTAGNWTKDSGPAEGDYPNAQNTFAVFNGTATVNVSSDVTVKLVRVTKGTLDLTASDGVKLTFPNGHDGSQFGGYDVSGDATLNLRAPSYYTSRFDMLGNGTINYYSTISGQQKDFYIHALVNNFRKGFVLNGNVFLAMGSMGSNAYQFNLFDDAKIHSGGATISISKGSVGTTIGYTVQDGDETEVITTANLAINDGGTSQPQHYTLKRGLLRVKDPNGVNGILRVGYNKGGGSFTQEGGTSELTRLEPTYGNAYLKGGTMTVYKEILYRDNRGGIFEMSGGTLNLDAGCTVSSPFTVSGGTVKFASGTTVSQPITFTGGVAEIPDGVVFTGAGKIVMNGGAVGVPADCTWSELQASLPARKVEGADIRFYGDNGQTVTFESGDVAPQAFNGVGDIRVVVEDMSSLANCTAIRASEVTLPDGGSLENQDLALTAGTKTYAEAIALNPKSLEVDGATILLNEGTDVITTVDRPVMLTSGSFEYNGKRLAYGENGKFIFNGGALKFPGGSGDVYTLGYMLDAVPHEGDRLNFMTAGSGTTIKILADTFTLPASLEIGSDVTLEVQANAQLIAASATPPALIVRNGGKVKIANQSAYIAAPIDLTIDQGGQLQVDAGGSGQYARTAIVAHSYTAWGVKKGVGKYETVKVATDPTAPFASVQGTASYIFVPYTWTGAGDGKSIGDTANWENGQINLSSTSVVMDFSRATGPVEVGAACKTWGVAYLPPEGGPATLRIDNAEGSTAEFSIAANVRYGASSICRKDCTIEFNVDVAGGTSQQVNWIGKGTYRFLKTLTQCHPDYFVLDGAVEIGGQLMTSNGNLCFCEDHHSESRMTFIDGAAVTLAGVISIDHNDGFTAGNGYYQTGGSVRAKILCLTRALRGEEYTRFAYRLSDGVLTLTESLILGGPNPLSPAEKVSTGGTFEMTGGTFTTPTILLENNYQFLHLFGGDVYLGAGGFAKTTSVHKDETVQSEASIVINGATLHATDDSWSAAEDLTVELRGPAGFDVAAEKEVVITGAVSGVGGIVKTGEGTLTIKGKYAATGSVTVSAGSLVLENVAEGLSLDALTLANGEALALPADAVVTVNRFIINGVYQPGGKDYTCGEGTVRVAEGSVGWIGPSGGKWSVPANWAGEVLPTADDAVYFPSALTTAEGGLSIEIDGAAAAGKLVLEAGTLEFTGGGALTLADSTEIAVAEGAELTFGPQVYAALRVSKTGKGLVTFNGGLRSLDDPATLVWPATNQLKVVQGEAKIACEVAGLRLFACSAVEADMPRVTLEEGAIATDRCWVQGPWAGLSATGYGEVVMNGGTADMQSGSSIFGDNGAGAPSLASDKFPIAFFKTGKAKFTLNGGTFRVHARFLPNLSNTNDNGGEVLVTIDGGELYVGTAYYLGTQNNEVDTLVLESGKLDVALFGAGSGKGKKRLLFNGGELAMHRSTIKFSDPALTSFVSGIEKNCWVDGKLRAGSDFEPVEIGGPVKFTQVDKDIDFLFGPQVIFKEGAELLDQEGPGTLSFNCVPEGDFAVKITNGGKVGLRFGTGTVKEVESVTVGSRMRVAGDYGESGRLPSRFPGGGIFRATTGGDAQGMTILVR